MHEAQVLRRPRKPLLGFLRNQSEDLETRVRLLFPELVLNSGWGRDSFAAQGTTFQGKKTDSFQPVTHSPECEGVKGRVPASSDSPVTCCWSGNSLFLITPTVTCLGKMFSHLLKEAMVFSKIMCFLGSSMLEIQMNDSIR